MGQYEACYAFEDGLGCIGRPCFIKTKEGEGRGGKGWKDESKMEVWREAAQGTREFASQHPLAAAHGCLWPQTQMASLAAADTCTPLVCTYATPKDAHI